MLLEIQLQLPCKLNFSKIDKFFIFLFLPLGTPVLNTLANTCLRWQSPSSPRGGGGAHTHSGLHLLVATWKCSSNYPVLPPSWQSRATSCQFPCFLFFFLWCTRYSRMQLWQAAFHPSFLIFLLSFFFFWACHFAGESWLGPWGVCAIFLRPNVAGNAGTLSTNLKDYQSQQTKGNLSPSQTTSWLAGWQSWP